MSVKLREKKLSKGGVSFYLDIYHNGKRNYETLGIKIDPKDPTSKRREKREIANLARNNREIELVSSGYNYIPKHLKKIKFFDYAEAYLDNYKKADKAMIDATIKKFKAYMKNDSVRLSNINKKDLVGYAEYLKEKAGLNGETPHNYFARLKKIFKDAHEHELITKNPCDGVKFSRKGVTDTIKKDVLTENELKILYKTKCKFPELKTAFLFACNTGLGLAEIHELKWSNLRNGILKTKRQKTGAPINFKLKESALKLLGEPKSDNEYVFRLLNAKGEKLTNNGAKHRLKVWLRDTEIDKHITFYCGRHTFATQLLIHGAGLKTVMDLLGQTDQRSVLKYVNYIGELKEKAIESLPDYGI